MKERILQAHSQPLVSENGELNCKELNVEETGSLNLISLFVFGCGVVGKELLKQISDQQLNLLARNIKVSVYGLANSTGLSLDVSGPPNLQKAELLISRNDANNLRELKEFVENNSIKNPVIVDCTSSRQVALAYIDFLQAGFHVVAANKIANSEPFSFYQSIRKASQHAARKFLYETNIGAGLPIIEPLQKLMTCGDELNKFEGILSGSLSYIFGEISQGVSFSEATLKAKQLGFTEPDPRVDLSGLDVARKVLIIAREIGLSIELSDIEVEGLIPKEISAAVDIDDFFTRLKWIDAKYTEIAKAASDKGCVLRYVARISGKKCSVSIDSVDELNPLYHVKNGENVFAFLSNYYQPKPMVVRGYGAGATVTAAGVFADILRII